MEAVHGRGQCEAVGIRTNPAFDWIRTEPPVREFSGWAGGVNVACIKENLITRVKHRCRGPTLVVIPRHLVFGLGERRPSFFQCGFHPVGELVDRFHL